VKLLSLQGDSESQIMVISINRSGLRGSEKNDDKIEITEDRSPIGDVSRVKNLRAQGEGKKTSRHTRKVVKFNENGHGQYKHGSTIVSYKYLIPQG
jgi:hypothetical protein